MTRFVGIARAAVLAAVIAAVQPTARPAFAQTPGCSAGTPQVCMTLDRCMAWDYKIGLGGFSKTCSQVYTVTYWYELIISPSGGTDEGRTP